ncbi:MAG: trypsin-like peptidase domain-containing protein, partial [Lachnospiraceae bacterium]|nr:trypsin-like peptidase domain-containing protein [Lachnospiraceae bacterium]
MDNNYYYNGDNYKAPESTTEKKKGKNTFGKVAAAGAMGLAFGVFGGLGFFAVQKTTGMIPSSASSDAAQAVIEESTAGSESTGSSENGTGGQSAVLNTVTNSAGLTGSGDVSEVAEALMPAMVSIKKEYTYTYGNDIYSYYFGGGAQSSSVAEASGSGFIIAQTDTEYLIVSNNHVVEDPLSLEVTFVDGSTASAYIKGRDASMDVAVIAVQKSDVEDSTKDAIRIVAIGDSENVKLGEQVVAIGNALGYGQSVTTGIVSAVNRELTMDDGSTGTYIQTDAAINPGNSGGALINMSGEVIGINSSKIGGTAIEGMGYAIPISSVTDIISDMMVQQTRIPIDESEMG